MKKFVISFVILSMFLAVSSQSKETTEHNIDQDTFLFVLSAKSGTMKDDTLTLKGVPNVVYFSDRPARIAGHKSMEDFEGMWNGSSDSFKKDTPNATLTILNDDGATNVVLELLSMKHEGDLCTFKVKVLEGNPLESFGTASLFVDSKIIGIDLGGG